MLHILIKYIVLISVLSVPLFYPSQSVANEVIGLELGNRLQSDGQGQYNQLWNKLTSLGVSKKLLVFPLKRALRNYKPTGNSCIFPSKINSLIKIFPQFNNSDFIASNGVDYVRIKVMTRPGEPVVKELSQLRGKRVAIWNGLDPKAFLPGLDVRIETTLNEEVRLKMLYGNRVDAIIGFIPDALIAADKLGIKVPSHEGAYTYFADSPITLVCYNTEENRKFINKFNTLIKQLKLSGELREILGPHARLNELKH